MDLEYIDTINLPEYSLCAIVNGDFTGLDAEDIENINTFMDENKDNIFDYGDDPYFSSSPAFGLPCDCIEAKIYKICK